MKDDKENTHPKFYVIPGKIPSIFTSDFRPHKLKPEPLTLEYWLSCIGKDNDSQLRRDPNKKLTIECQWGKYSESFTILAKVEDTDKEKTK